VCVVFTLVCLGAGRARADLMTDFTESPTTAPTGKFNFVVYE
jgi:hypothetical protein